MTSTTQPTVEAVLVSHLSPARFAPYLAETGSVAAAIKLYRWNIELSGAIHESLAIVEVALRNALDRQLQVWNQSRPAPAGQAPYGTNWVERPAAPLGALLNPTPHKSTYLSARYRAIADSNLRDPSHPRHGAAPNHDDLVAHITFGTWVKLLPSKKDSQYGFGPNKQRGLWVNALKDAFPHHPDPLVVHHWTQRLHQLRNRIAHVEPLIATDVISYHRSAARLLLSIDPTVGSWYAGVSRIPRICKERP
ncbi:MAG: Abi family protein [Leucobacter sp.]|uniref:Abi family protein n=1 Tax=Brachybacterium TaxID=43668 RepID=UPI001865BB86|nr:Abi family protein [Brachybacterium sp. FME24]MDN5822482.1 Abi family protein [Brachybacterium sp.]MDN6303511.1 Abi family protein [Brachybacterium sp.]MDN6330359.1 Abi family protein [Brachybacterium sp.]